jgi:D-beta-D-heptose 7-phosphate kinase/D-beta-D-heptose 1-phosphate adenosyltransferase
VHREQSVPGGACNVAWNVQSLGGQAVVAGFVGSDAPARQLDELLGRGGVILSADPLPGGLPTTVKTRIVAEHQQVCRVDWDSLVTYDPPTLAAFRARLSREIGQATGVIIEDYGKGVVQQPVVDHVLAEAARRKVPVGLDPKDNEQMAIPRITLATPNRKEAFGVMGLRETAPLADPLQDEPLLEASRLLQRKWNTDLLLVTLGPKGMLLVTADGPRRHIPTRAREVYDVSGAGDTVIAVCLTALAAGASYEEAAEMGNYAAGVVVGKLGTATCSPDELLQAIHEDAGPA